MNAPAQQTANGQIVNNQTVIQADNLSRHYTVSQGFLQPKGTVRALSDASFTLAAGRTLAVVGESGCGKSTLARQLTLIERPTGGRLVLGGVDVAQAGKEELKALRTRVQMVFQNPYASLNPRHTVGAQIGEPLAINNANLGKAERRERVRAIMARVGLRAEHDARYPHMFSGGQRQRIAVARAMILNPEIVVADEPTSALDVSIQAQVLNLFMDLQQEMGMAYVFISHNLSVVEHVADDVMVMYLGRVVERGPKARVFSRPLHPYTHSLLAATPTLDGPRRERVRLVSEPPSPLNPPSGCAFHGRCPHADAQCSQQLPEPRQVDERWVACHHVERING